MNYTPPQDIEIEKAVLGAILLENDALEEVLTILKHPTDFCDLRHRIIFDAILEMYSKSVKMDILTISDWIRKKGLLDQAGGAGYLLEIHGRVSSHVHVDTHARILAELAIGRRILELTIKIQSQGNSKPDYLDMLENLSKEVYKLEGNYFVKDTQSIMALSKQVMDEVQKAAQKQDGITGEISGIEAIDEYTKGFGKQDLIIIAARPGMGKSSLVHTILRCRAVDHQKPIALFSLEMSSVQVTKVLHAHQTGIDHQKLKDGKLSEQEWGQYHARIGPLLNAPIFLDDTPAISITEIRAKSRRLVSKYGVSMVIVDYLQLATAGYSKDRKTFNREQEISEISRGLKALAKELDIPVIALAQLSRESEKRGNKLPQLSDLRDSGAIEQDADMVMFLFRPAYYKMDRDEAGNDIPKHLTKVIVAKYREGDLGEIDLRFIGRLKMFDSNPYGGNDSSYGVSPSKINMIPSKFDSSFSNQENTEDEPF